MDKQDSIWKYVAPLIALAVLIVSFTIGALILGAPGKPPLISTEYRPDPEVSSKLQSPNRFCSSLAEIYVNASSVYAGTLDEFDFSGPADDGADELPVNLGYPTGTPGLQAYLADVKAAMTQPGQNGALWSYAENVRVQNPVEGSERAFTYLSPDGAVGFEYDADANGEITGNTRQQLEAAVDTKASSPQALFDGFPTGC